MRLRAACCPFLLCFSGSDFEVLGRDTRLAFHSQGIEGLCHLCQSCASCLWLSCSLHDAGICPWCRQTHTTVSEPLVQGLILQPRVESSKIPAARPSALGPSAGISVHLNHPLGQDTCRTRVLYTLVRVYTEMVCRNTEELSMLSM